MAFLNNDINLLILEYLPDVRDKVNFAKTCTSLNPWTDLVGCWKTVHLTYGSSDVVKQSDTTQEKDLFDFLLSYSSEVVQLVLVGEYSGREDFQSRESVSLDVLGKFPNLRFLKMENLFLKNATPNSLSERQLELNSLNISFSLFCPSTAKNFTTLICTQSLKEVVLDQVEGYPKEEDICEFAESCVNLETLHIISHEAGGSDNFFAALSKRKHLKSFRFDLMPSAQKEVHDSGFVKFCMDSENLEHLSLEHQVTLGSSLLLWLGKLTHLRRLYLVHCHVTPPVIAELSKLPYLEEIYTSGFSLNNEAGHCFSDGFPCIKKLQISSATMWDQGFTSVANSQFAPSLKWACMAACRSLDNSALITLSNAFKSLSYLDLSFCYNITDKGIIGAGPVLGTLLHLKLVSCYRLTPASVDVIIMWLPALKSLDLSLIWNIPEERFNELRVRKKKLVSLIGRNHIVFIGDP